MNSMKINKYKAKVKVLSEHTNTSKTGAGQQLSEFGDYNKRMRKTRDRQHNRMEEANTVQGAPKQHGGCYAHNTETI